MTLRTLRLLLLLAVALTPVSSWAQATTGNAPFLPDAGSPDPNVPVIDNDAIILCIGMSQAHWECGGMPSVGTGGWVSQSTLPVVIVDGAISGWEVERITDPALSDEYWNGVEDRVRTAGYTNADVQVMWGKNATRVVENNPDLLAQRIILRDALIEIQAEAERRFPNLRAGFHSPRVYGGHCRANPEPIAYETYQSIVGWGSEPGAIESSSKWFLGPYIWADGTSARADGLTWLVTDFVMEPVSGPGCHPSQSGIDKVATHAELFFSQLTYAPPGSSPPNAPSGLSATAAGTTQINLSWTDNSNDETSFHIERAAGQGAAFSEIATPAANVTNFSDTGRTANTEYCYRVRASNSNGDSGYTAQVCATTNAAGGSAPSAPSGLTASASSDMGIDLSWTDNSNDETSFRVERATGQGGAFSEIANTAANVGSYDSRGLAASTEYCYRVRARNADGDSAYTATVCATTNASGGTAPTAPSGLTATASSDMGIDLSWTDNSNDETSFRVERATGQGGAFSEIANTAMNVSSYDSRSLAASTEYCYRVRARNSTGDSAYTATVCATTDATAPPPPDPGVRRSGGGATGLPDIAVLLLFGAGFAARRKTLARANHS